MKNKLLPKHILVAAAIMSLCAFAFVNLDARDTSCREQAAAKGNTAQIEQQQQDDAEDRKLKTPDVMVLTRIIDLVQKFTNTSL